MIRIFLTGLFLIGLTAIAHPQERDSTLTSCLPLRRLTLTSPFGYRVHPLTGSWQFHKGIDLAAHRDTVFCIADGMVLQTGYDPLLGIYIRVAHADGLTSIYGHLSMPWVFTGETVMAGTAIGVSGNTGRTTGEHLHFSINYNGRPLDPLAFLKALLLTN